MPLWAQVLAYAAYLHGLTPTALENDVVGTRLRARGYEILADAVRAMDQEGSFDDEVFAEGLRRVHGRPLPACAGPR